MSLDSLTAVQARISQIQAMFDPRTAATAASSGTGAGATSTEFASLLSDAMASGALGTGTDPTGSSPGGLAGSGSSVLGQLGQLGQIAQLSQAANGSGLAAATATATGGSGAGSSLALQFLDTALAQKGKPYIYGATASESDPNPKAFDCSELTKWAAARVGDPIPDGATAQYLYLRDHGTTMSVDQALHTPGALLFHFGHEPKNLGDIPADGHVAISVGDGVHTIEARGHKYGTGIFDATSAGRGGFFNYAGMIPGMA